MSRGILKKSATFFKVVFVNIYLPLQRLSRDDLSSRGLTYLGEYLSPLTI